MSYHNSYHWWEYPFATNLSLYHSIDSSEVVLILYTQRQPTTLLPGGRGTKSLVSVLCKAESFSSIACWKGKKQESHLYRKMAQRDNE
jgi:hypothetical protein